eukprot:Hpha_TRINITY_DN11675_c0_g1::TRINITY_DN11675_c0_g1_i1::g.49196::m.49196
MLAPCKHCGACFSGCGDVCESCCDGAKELIFPRNGANRLFSIFAVGMSIAVIAVACEGLVAEGDDCTGAAQQWLISGVVAASLNALGAVLLHWRFEAEIMKHDPKEKRGKMQTVWHFACYDCGVFIYLVLVGGIIYWYVASGRHMADCSDALDALSTARTLFQVFFIVGPCLACCALAREPGNEIEPDNRYGYGGIVE